MSFNAATAAMIDKRTHIISRVFKKLIATALAIRQSLDMLVKANLQQIRNMVLQ